MTKLVWDEPDSRTYESGVSRGVLYPFGGPGVVWNGIVSVEESSDGGEIEPLYFDGVNYLNVATNKTFQAKLKAHSAPTEFQPCVGLRSIVPGFILTRQERTRFGFSYRTEVNDSDYKIHIIYNALATPNTRGYKSITNAPVPVEFEWSIDAIPPEANGYRPTAHFIIDSRKTHILALQRLENVLYGVDEPPRLPTPDELIEMTDTRFVIVIPTPSSPLPVTAREGDVIFSVSDDGVYALGAPSEKVRPVIVIHGNNPNLLPENALPGDLVYDETTGILYELGA